MREFNKAVVVQGVSLAGSLSACDAQAGDPKGSHYELVFQDILIFTHFLG